MEAVGSLPHSQQHATWDICTKGFGGQTSRADNHSNAQTGHSFEYVFVYIINLITSF
jgi:hypothetical protein